MHRLDNRIKKIEDALVTEQEMDKLKNLPQISAVPRLVEVYPDRVHILDKDVVMARDEFEKMTEEIEAAYRAAGYNIRSLWVLIERPALVEAGDEG